MATRLLTTLLACMTIGTAAIHADNLLEKPQAEVSETPTETPTHRLTIGGYGEAVASRMFYSNNYKRYTNAELYKGDKGFGQFDLPHVVLYLGYDFGKGWSLGTEIEFEHGGTESAVEIEEEETGEYESEVERGGEVALEQFWLQKSFSHAVNLRMGHMVVPVGGTNNAHMPTEFFTVYRPEGENTIMPCTWHETGVSLWGNVGKWRYEAMFIAGLDADRFGNKGWIHDGAGSPYEFKMATSYAGALRIDNRSIKGLRLSVSGYLGNSANNTLNATGKYNGLHGTVAIGAVDFLYNDHNIVARGNFDYGHLSNSLEITTANMSTRADSPFPKTNIGEAAIALGIEAGYDIFSQVARLHADGQRLYLFGRYDYYDSMYKTVKNMTDEKMWQRQKVTAGVNYYPIPQIVIKGEYSYRILSSQYNNEPTVSLGICYSGLFHI
ncbi:MAG: hypothetical protein IJK93_03665 [Muribaculaceae bacterium]|nr:hypothetical protein [Muribaculaceae bacterium]